MEGYTGFYIDNARKNEFWIVDTGLYVNNTRGDSYGSGTRYYDTGNGFSGFTEGDYSLLSSEYLCNDQAYWMRYKD